ncbi:winged helix-turn-helix domain-containing protein [Rhodopseudomonas sp. BR0C11]|uniref:winged helix-turn-helix domain-containing protein n=1 Tax=Rhodopseudomonas sp. BR0C11 TaxID=2269370 RepID=UPI0032DE9E57
MTLRDDLIASLEAENDQLRERCRQLETMLGIRFEAPPLLCLTQQEAVIFGCLLKNRIMTRDALMIALYQGRDEAEAKIVDVFVCKMRKKLKPYGILVQTKWGEGYYFDADSKARAQNLLDQVNAQ